MMTAITNLSLASPLPLRHYPAMTSPQPSTPRRAIGERELVAMMALQQALVALAIDAMLPALGVMSHDLGVADPNDRQLVVGLFLVGAGVGALLPGALADRFGRRPLLLASLLFYTVTAAACALVTDFTALLGLRFVQAVGSGGLSVLPAAVIRDRFDGDRMARLQSLIAMIFLTVPMLAPTLGQAVLLVAGWRWIFGVMALLAVGITAWVWTRLPETLDPENRQPVQAGAIARNMRLVLTTRESIGYVLGSALMMSATWAYINSSQQLIAEHFRAGTLFPVVFGAVALSMAAANFTNSRIVERFGARRVSHTALFGYIAVAVVQVILAHQPGQTLWSFVPALMASMFLGGFVGANFGSIALQPFGRTAGSAASVQAFLRMVLAAVLGAAVGQAFDGTARPLSWSFVFAGLMTLAMVLFSEKGRLFRRLHPPATMAE